MNKWMPVYLLSIAAIQLAYAETASAQNYSCSGQVTKLALNGLGIVQLALGAPASWTDGVNICSVDSVVNGISPATCKAMYGLLLTAATTHKVVTFSFYPNGSPSTACHGSTTPPQVASSLLDSHGYLLNGPAWYYGPELTP